MQKLSDVRHPRVDEYDSLKALWLKCFDDAPSVVDRFFENAVTPENTVALFYDETAVSVLYMVESTIKNNGVNYKAFYIYAVCTDPDYRGRGLMKKSFDFLFRISKERGVDYLFLVPADESLFTMYKKLGFKNGFYYSKRKVYSKDFVSHSKSYEELTFEDYINIRNSFSKEINLATLGKNGFKAFLSPESENVKAIKIGNSYGAFENESGLVIVHEIFGDEESILQCIFNLTKADSLDVRCVPQKGNSEPFGMYLVLSDAPPVENAFFGIPYGG